MSRLEITNTPYSRENKERLFRISRIVFEGHSDLSRIEEFRSEMAKTDNKVATFIEFLSISRVVKFDVGYWYLSHPDGVLDCVTREDILSYARKYEEDLVLVTERRSNSDLAVYYLLDPKLL